MESRLKQHLIDLETALKAHKQWESIAPSAEALASTQPFCVESLSPTQWLQWIFIPRMHALLEAKATLPRNFCYYALFGRSIKKTKSI